MKPAASLSLRRVSTRLDRNGLDKITETVKCDTIPQDIKVQDTVQQKQFNFHKGGSTVLSNCIYFGSTVNKLASDHHLMSSTTAAIVPFSLYHGGGLSPPAVHQCKPPPCVSGSAAAAGGQKGLLPGLSSEPPAGAAVPAAGALQPAAGGGR